MLNYAIRPIMGGFFCIFANKTERNQWYESISTISSYAILDRDGRIGTAHTDGYSDRPEW